MSNKEINLQVFDERHKHLGHFDGEFFYTIPHINYRADGEEVYSQTGSLVGYITDGRVENTKGEILYYLTE